MDKETKKQHYVFRGYLKPWAVADQVYCLRDNRIFQANLNKIACERFFYQLQELTPHEIEVVENLFRDHPSESLKAAQKDFLSIYRGPLMIRRELGDSIPKKLREALDRIIREGQEDYHQRIESELLVFLRSMLAGDTSFYSDNERAAKIFTCHMCPVHKDKADQRSYGETDGQKFSRLRCSTDDERSCSINGDGGCSEHVYRQGEIQAHLA